MRTYFLCIGLLLPVISYCQSAFYSLDSTLNAGVKLVDGGEVMNAKFCQVKVRNKIVRYSPYEVDKYGFKRGATFISFDIQSGGQMSRYFLEQVVAGKVDLYYLREKKSWKLYTQDSVNSELFELSDSESLLHQQLEEYVRDCAFSARNVPFVKFKKHSVRRFFEDYNSCAERPFPRTLYGIAAGMSASQFAGVGNTGIYTAPDYTYGLSPSYAVFMNHPIKTSNFSIQPELFYQQTNSANDFFFGSTENDLLLRSTSLGLTAPIRYTIITSTVSPYFQAGPAYVYTIHQETPLYQYQYVDDAVYIDIDESAKLQNSMGGFSAGLGFTAWYGSRFPWFAELRYHHFYNLSEPNNFLRFHAFALRTGIMLSGI